jgi:hypothetical protein
MLDESRVGLIAGVGLVLTVAVNFFSQEAGRPSLTGSPAAAEVSSGPASTILVSHRLLPSPAPLDRPDAAAADPDSAHRHGPTE